MQFLRHWSLLRVLLVSCGWLFLWVFGAAALMILKLRSQVASSGSGGIGAVSFGVNALVSWLIIVPPIGLVAAWAIVRWFVKSPPAV